MTTMLVDLSSMLYRAWFAVPDTVRTPAGEQINGAYGFLNMLARLIADHEPTALACATDDDWRPQWRVDLIESYKAHRLADDAADSDENLGWQEEVACGLLGMCGVAVVGSAGWEAEDVIGSLAKARRGRIAIVSGDRDLFQLVRDPNVYVLYPKRGVSDLVRVTEEYIADKYAIPGRAYADFATLRGDPSDGLPGVKGIGEKTAAILISKYGTIEDVVKAAKREPAGALAKVAAQFDYLERATKVVRITGEAPVDDPDINLPVHPPDADLKQRASDLGLWGPVERLLEAIG